MPSSKNSKTSSMTEVTELTSLMALDSDSDSTVCCLLPSQLFRSGKYFFSYPGFYCAAD